MHRGAGQDAGGDVEMCGRTPRTPGDDVSEDDNTNERTPLSGHDSHSPGTVRRGAVDGAPVESVHAWHPLDGRRR